MIDTPLASTMLRAPEPEAETRGGLRTRLLTWVPSKPQLPMLIASGYVLRWLVLPLTAHFDALFIPWQASIVLHGQPNVYDALYRVFGETSISPIPWAANMPGYYFLTAGWLWLMRGLGLLSFADWGFLATDAAGVAAVRGVAMGLVLGSFDHPSSALFLLELPYFVIDIAVGWMLYRLGGSNRGLLAWATWSLYPIVLYTPFVTGQADLLPAFFVTLSLFLAHRALSGHSGDPSLVSSAAAVAALGLGAATKTYPLFLVPIAAVLLGGGLIRRAVLLGLAGFSVFFLAVVPFAGSEAFRRSALLNHEGMRLFAVPTPLLGTTGALPIVLASPFVALYIAVLVWAALRAGHRCFGDLWRAWLIGSLALRISIQAAPYWHIWAAPWSPSRRPATGGPVGSCSRTRRICRCGCRCSIPTWASRR